MKSITIRRVAAIMLLSTGLAVASEAASAQEQSPWAGGYVGALVGKGFANIGGPASSGLGWTGGVFGGYNFATDGHLLLGVEADAMWSGRGTPDYDIPYTASLRGRVGFTLDRFGAFAAGGLSLAGFNYQGSHSTEIGFTLGGGVEFRFERVTARVEYLYNRYGVISGTDITAATHEIRWGFAYTF